VRTILPVSERRACRVLAQPRSTQRHRVRVPTDEPALIARLVALAQRFARYGYRRITALLRAEGWRVNHKRVERLWRQEGLRVPRKARRRRRLWAADGSCTRRRAERPNQVWSYDFVSDRTQDGRPLRLLTLVDEYTRECLSIDVARRLRADDVLARLTTHFVRRGAPAYLRSDNGPEFTAKAVRTWLQRLGVTTLFIEPGSPWENGYVESFNGKLRDECLNPEIFTTLTEAQILVERWRQEYNQVRPHSTLGYRPPAPEAREIAPPHPAPWADRRVPALT
jgi:transposase InsO family protein